MENLREIALRVAGEVTGNKFRAIFPITDFAEALLAEIAKENEPEYYLWEHKYGDVSQMLSHNSGPHPDCEVTPLYTLPPTTSQIEQETAEACAKLLEVSAERCKFPSTKMVIDACVDIIRNGAWKEHLK